MSSEKNVQAKIPIEIADWFDMKFGHGAKQWFIAGCFLALHSLVEEGKIPDLKMFSEAAVLKTLFASEENEAA